RAGRVTVRVRPRAGGLDAEVALDGANAAEGRVGRGRARVQCAAVALGAGAVEDHLALLLELIEFGVGVREGRRACADGLGQQLDPGRGEEGLLKSCQVVEHALGRLDRNLRVREERAACLLLERAEARVVLVAALSVRPVRVYPQDGNA